MNRSIPTIPSTASSSPAPSSCRRWAPADRHLESDLPQHLVAAGIDVLHEDVTWRHSSNGKYVSVRIAFRARLARGVRPRPRRPARPPGSEVDALSSAALPPPAGRSGRTRARCAPPPSATSVAAPTSRSGAPCRRFTDARTDDSADELWLVEHEPVFTLGQAGKPEHVLMPGDIPVHPRRPRRPGDLPRPRPDSSPIRCWT